MNFPRHLIERLDDDDKDARHDKKLLSWFAEKSGPEDWHRFALGANWDFVEPELLQWIVKHPDCDRATALVLFWKSQPDYFLQFAGAGDVPDVNKDGFELISAIRSRWIGGNYSRSEFSFEMDRDVWPQDFELMRSSWPEQFSKIPAEMLENLNGREVPNTLTDGLPDWYWKVEEL